MSTTDNEKVKANDIFKTANIIIAGITGAGKSTLINAVFGKDFAETGKGRPVTQEIREYQRIRWIIFTLFGTALIREEADTSLQKRNL